jgi:hypothetical protein
MSLLRAAALPLPVVQALAALQGLRVRSLGVAGGPDAQQQQRMGAAGAEAAPPPQQHLQALGTAFDLSCERLVCALGALVAILRKVCVHMLLDCAQPLFISFVGRCLRLGCSTCMRVGADDLLHWRCTGTPHPSHLDPPPDPPSRHHPCSPQEQGLDCTHAAGDPLCVDGLSELSLAGCASMPAAAAGHLPARVPAATAPLSSAVLIAGCCPLAAAAWGCQQPTRASHAHL